MSITISILALAGLGALAYWRASYKTALTTIGVLAVVSALVLGLVAAPTIVLIVFIAVLAPLGLGDFRRRFITGPLAAWYQRTLPALSDTEQAALEAGTVWWDAELFSGDPDWSRLLSTPAASLSAAEQAYLDGPVEQLCGMLDDWEIQQLGDLPPQVWSFCRNEGFFGLQIAQQYGGLGFSSTANSAIVMKIASRSVSAAVTVMVPNSLGPGELLQHYGTDAQKKHHLPRLASGDDIPCFALTSPVAGSDAGAMTDTGIICRGNWQGEEVLGFRLNWDKRYITLAPVADLLGLAFKAQDPEQLLGDEANLGITCALVPTDLPGVTIGRRHQPSSGAFMNGPIQGKDVFIPLDAVIGGADNIGQGWSMLVQSLAAGRAISLPALSVAGAKIAAHSTGAYARIRKQFKMPIGYFEGVEEVLARLAARTFRDDATRLLTLSALQKGEKPSVLSAIVKAYLTDSNRQAINDAMDVHGGKGIMQGPRNYLMSNYQLLPIAITVEGANILTRSMIIFGQGAIRAHPYILSEMQSAQHADTEEGLRAFDEAFFSHIGFALSNFVRTFWLGITGARFVSAPVDGPTAHYYRQITRMSSAFALLTDLVLVVLGGRFKFREKLSGRLADTLAHMYMVSAVLKQFEDSQRPLEDLPLVNWAIRDSLYVIQLSLINVIRNFPLWWLRKPLKMLVFPLGMYYRQPSDNLGKRAARMLLQPGAARDRLTSGVYQANEGLGMAELNQAFELVNIAARAEKRLRAITHETVTPGNVDRLLAQTTGAGTISREDADLILAAQQAVARVVAVDDFAADQARESAGKASTAKPEAAVSQVAGRRPVSPGAENNTGNMPGPVSAAKDDLQRIKGIGPKISLQLEAMGYVSFAQIAGLSAQAIEEIGAQLKFKGRIEREKWLEQARALVDQGE